MGWQTGIATTGGCEGTDPTMIDGWDGMYDPYTGIEGWGG
jgi:hypothetical protein